MPRLTHVIHPYFGRLPVNRVACPSCGVPAGEPCYLLCERSPAYYSPEQEREEALTMDAEVAAVGWQAYDSAQHRAHGLPCPYDGYDPAYEDEHAGDWPLVPLADGTPAHSYVMVEAPPARKCGFEGCDRDATVYGGFGGAGGWACPACDEHSSTPGFAVWDRYGSPTLPHGQDDVPF